MQFPFSSPQQSGTPATGPAGPERLIHRLSAVMLGGVGLLLLGLVAGPTGSAWSQVTRTARMLGLVPAVESSVPASEERASPQRTDLPSHPSFQLGAYFSLDAASSPTAPTIRREFHHLLRQYVLRQGRDDNFTIRVIDRRSNDVLEVYELADLRSAYGREQAIDWEEVDARRREAMERLVDKHEADGVPVDKITVRWGRANQVELAQQRDRAYQAYERKLAEYLGLSLLATEIGTVETFNQDDLVSAAGARSRYQMLPWIMRRSGVNEYTLPTAGDEWVRVREEHHPLLVLEPAFLLLRGYVNAVGHEMPGLSAYHTGPGNIFKLYRQYFEHSGRLTTASTVADAYAWAVTEGFQAVREGSSFGGHSRGYVPALYGSLAARDDRRVAATPALQTARVQVKPGTSLRLGDVLAALDSTGRSLDWGPAAAGGSLYQRFRALNPHIDLPPAESGTMPQAGNVRFISSVDGKAVRFFLPRGAPTLLRRTGLTAIDSSATFRFDGSTYAAPAASQVTRADRQYTTLVDDIEHFGFTERNRDRLLALHDRFETLAEQNPTRYRRRQLQIISTHRRLWLSNPWDELADATKRATGRMQVPTSPPDSLVIDTFNMNDLPLGSLE